MTATRPVPLVRRFYRDLADGTAGRIEEQAQCGEEGWSRRAGEAAERLRRRVDGFPGTELEEVGREHRRAVLAYRETWEL